MMTDEQEKIIGQVQAIVQEARKDKGGMIGLSKKIGLAPMTIEKIVKGNMTRIRDTTFHRIKEFVDFEFDQTIRRISNKEKDKSEEKLDPPTRTDELIETEEDLNYGELNFTCKLRELLSSKPKGIKLIITIEK